MKVAIAHDYLTQRGGAERVVVELSHAFPDAPIHTSFYEPHQTFPELAARDVRPAPINRVGVLRRRHRLALPLLAPVFDRIHIEADAVICSSSGWAHGAHVAGRKIVYCHTPARWLYDGPRYLGDNATLVQRLALQGLGNPLRRWDRAAAGTADLYIANSTAVRDRIARVYGIGAEIVHPPPALGPGEQRRLDGVEPGFLLCVARLLPYKNIDAILGAFDLLPGARLVVAGTGPDASRLRRLAGPNTTFVGRLEDAELRWLYAHSTGLVAASHEDYGLTPLEAAAFGRPSAVLRFGGFLDTVREDETGVFFDTPDPKAIAAAVTRMAGLASDERALRAHAETFSAPRFRRRIRELVA